MSNTYSLWNDRYLKFAGFWSLFALGGFLLWAGLAPLAQGIVGFGKVVGEDERKIIQHFEGGIIDTILVREGDSVEKGDPLIILTDVATLGVRDQMAKDLVDAQASVERLAGLLNGDRRITFSATPAQDMSTEILTGILKRQEQLFYQQRQTLLADIGVYRTRRQGLLTTANNQQVQIDSNENTLSIVRRELNQKRKLLREGLIQADKVSDLEREEARLRGETARFRTDQETARSQVLEIDRQMTQTRARFNESLTTDLLEHRSKVSEISKRLTTAKDIISRSTIYAPQSGSILNLKFTTKGGVVQSGEAILEIVPDRHDLHAIIHISPSDRDEIYIGLEVETRLSGLNSWNSPTLNGQIIGLSADLKTSPNGELNYYEARISIDATDLAAQNIKALPGMPIEVFIHSGEPRTLMNYLIEPLSATLRRSAKS